MLFLEADFFPATINKWSDMTYNSSRSFFIPALTLTAVEILLSAAPNIPSGVEWAIGTFLVREKRSNLNPLLLSP
jgi:hypothetical protein